MLVGSSCLAAPTKEDPNTGKRSKENGTTEEYSGDRSSKNLRAALGSKGFAWLSGSPADNEKLSIGKNAQFFGFVALRYQSGRAANRGALGRAFFELADAEQRKILPKAVLAEAESLDAWWKARAKILRLFENHLYTGEPIDQDKAAVLGADFSKLGATVAIHEARAFAALEDSLTAEQTQQLRAWRIDPEKAGGAGKKVRVTDDTLDRDQSKQLEDLYAKAFSWLTGTPTDNEIIPLGQPAQFFGFVSIRHKSGHAANRGRIAKSFLAILDSKQRRVIDQAIEEQTPVVERFLKQRHLFLQQLQQLRTRPDAFDLEQAMKLAESMGELEAEAGWIEATAYRKIRESMSDEQTASMMKLRVEYVLDPAQVEQLAPEARGAQLAILCAGCHGTLGQPRSGMVGPPLDGLFDRPIASHEGFDYSDALKQRGKQHWTSETLDQFLAAPKKFAPGTKMEFQGLLNPADRKALIDHLNKPR